MKRLSIILALFAVTASLAAQQNAALLLKQKLDGGRVSFNYDCTTIDKVPVTQKGKVIIDGSRYLVRGNGLEIWCDGKTRWTVDNEACEVYIESADADADFLANPGAYLEYVKDLSLSGSSASGIFTPPGQDTAIKFKFTSITSSPRKDDGAGFSFDVSALGSDWVVTDLR